MSRKSVLMGSIWTWQLRFISQDRWHIISRVSGSNLVRHVGLITVFVVHTGIASNHPALILEMGEWGGGGGGGGGVHEMSSCKSMDKVIF